MIKLLLGEADPQLAKNLSVCFEEAGYEIKTLLDGLQILEQLKHPHHFDVAILDVRLPQLGGLELVNHARATRSPLPILLTSTQASIEQCVAGLNQGADDFMSKPLQFIELEARVRALVRRYHFKGAAHLHLGDLRYDPLSRAVYWKDRILDFSARELALLSCLLRHTGEVVSKELLVQDLQPLSSNAIEVIIHRIRKKLKPTGIHVRTLRGMGYSLEF